MKLEEDNDYLTTIKTFTELMNEITYAWDSNFGIRKTDEGIFVIHKLYIGKNWIQYKEHIENLAPGLYEKVEILYKLLIDTP